jgi:hypothetical protein
MGKLHAFFRRHGPGDNPRRLWIYSSRSGAGGQRLDGSQRPSSRSVDGVWYRLDHAALVTKIWIWLDGRSGRGAAPEVGAVGDGLRALAMMAPAGGGSLV